MAKGSADASLGKDLRTLFGTGTLAGLSDGELLDRFLERDRPGSEPAFSALVERHGPMVLGVCRRFLRDGHLAEDVFQATFLILAKRAATIHGRASIGGWLHRVARRTSLRAQHQAERRRTRETSEVDPDEIVIANATAIDRDDLKATIDEELDRLGEPQRQAVILCCVEGLSHEQAASLLRWPVGTVKSRLGRARDQLRRRLTRRGFTPGVAWPFAADFPGKDLLVTVPKSLAESTCRSAFQFVAGSSATATGPIASAIVTLANKELAAMIFVKWKAIALILAASTAAVGLAGFSVAWTSGHSITAGSALAQVASKVVQTIRDNAPTLLSAHGQVVDSKGNPVAGATVYLREWSTWRSRGLPPERFESLFRGETLNDILAQTKSDADGRFQFENVQALVFQDQQTQGEVGIREHPWDVVALAEGYALGWVKLTPKTQRSAFTLTLPEEGSLRGRIVEPGGRPVAGATIRVSSVFPLGEQDQVGLRTDGILNLSWSSLPIASTSDAQGRFQIRGLPRDMQMRLVATEAGHERKFLYAATTNGPQPDLVRNINDRVAMREERYPVLTGDCWIEMKSTDQRLVARAVFEANGKPASGATVLTTGMRAPRKTDADGRFEIANLAEGSLELHLYAESAEHDSAPLDLTVEIPSEPKVFEKTFILPRGLIVQGKVVDGAAQAGIGGVSIHYSPPSKLPAGRLPTMFAIQTKTKSDGRFRIVIPSGPGELRIQELPPAYAQQRFPIPGTSDRSSPLRNGLTREVDGRPGQIVNGVDFAITRGGTLTFRVLDPEGKPVPGAIVKRRDWAHINKPDEKTNRDGQFVADGLDAATRTTFDVYHPKEQLGARLVSPEAATHEGPMSFEVKLKPLGSATATVTDEKGKPLPSASLRLTTVVQNGGFTEPAGEGVRPDGTFSLGRLVPGVEYDIALESPGFAKVENYRLTAKSAETQKLPEFRLPVFDRPLSGVIVDPRGKPIVGASISYQYDFSAPIRFSPSGRHFQDTDEQGRFQLDGLPRGKITLMAYRRPAPPSNSITNMIRVEAEPGQTEIRIEIPDANRRLQGIED